MERSGEKPVREVRVARAADLDARGLEAASAGLRASAAFRPALARYCLAMSDVPAEGWPLYKMFDQLSRYLICYMLIYNYYGWRDHGGPPPTLSALQKLVPSSPRQTAGFVASLKVGRFITTEDDPADRRNKLLRPGPAVIGEIGRSPRLFLRALDEIESPAERRAPRLAAPELLGRMVHFSAADVLANGTLLHGFPTVLHFAQRDCGYPLLTAIMADHYARTLPAVGAPPSLTRRALAQRFQVSAAHVGNLIGEAAAHGWFVLEGADRVAAVAPDFAAEFERWCSLQMIHVAGLWDSVEGARAVSDLAVAT